MKTRIKAAVVLNSTETGLLAGILRKQGSKKAYIDQSDEHGRAQALALEKEEQAVVKEFLQRHDDLNNMLILVGK